MLALPAKLIVGDTVSLIEKQRPFLFPLFAHSRHTDTTSFPFLPENRKSPCFPLILGAILEHLLLCNRLWKQGLCIRIQLYPHAKMERLGKKKTVGFFTGEPVCQRSIFWYSVLMDGEINQEFIFLFDLFQVYQPINKPRKYRTNKDCTYIPTLCFHWNHLTFRWYYPESDCKSAKNNGDYYTNRSYDIT